MPFTIPNVAAAAFEDQADPDSRDFDILLGGSGLTGVVSGCAVTSTGAGNGSLTVAAGSVRIDGRRVTVAGGTVAIGANSSGNPRFDLVTVDTAGTAAAVAGTAAAAPEFPTIPASRVVLAAMYVPNGHTTSTTIAANTLTDKRVILRDGSARILPETYGALGNARFVKDATITSAGTTVTSATAAFVSGDTGRTFVFEGAGASGGLLTGTFTYISATTGTLSVAAGTTVASPGKEFWLGTDDTLAIQQALTAAKFGDTVYLDPEKAYLHTARNLGGCATTASSTTFTGSGFVAGDVGKSATFEFSQNDVFQTIITGVSGTTITVATAIPTTAGSTACLVGLLSVHNPGSGLSGRGALVSTDHALCALQVINTDDVTIADIFLRNPNTSRQVTRYSCAMFLWKAKRLRLEHVNVDGAGGTGVYAAQVDGFVFERLVVQNTRADGVHMTNASCNGVVNNPTTRYVGDDGIAVVSYTFDVAICHDIEVYSPRCMGEMDGRGVAVVGGNDISYYDVYVERSSGAGVYIAAEPTVNVTTMGCRNVRVIGGEVLQCNTDATADHGGLMIYNGQAGAGYKLEHISVEALTITDSRRTASGNVIVNTDSASNAIHRILLAQINIVGGDNTDYYAGGAPDSATQVNRYAWLVDGRTVTDVIPWGGYVPVPFADGTVGAWRSFAAVYGGINLFQQPSVTNEWLCQFHTGRGTRAMVVGDSGKVFFVRIDVTRKGGQQFNAAGIGVTVVQVAGTVNSAVGLYKDNGTGARPTGAPLYDWGATTTLLTPTGDKVATISTNPVGGIVPPGVYWIAWGYREATAPSTRPTVATATGQFQIPGTSLNATPPGSGWHQTGWGGGALPTVGTLVRETTTPLIGLRSA